MAVFFPNLTFFFFFFYSCSHGYAWDRDDPIIAFTKSVDYSTLNSTQLIFQMLIDSDIEA